MFRLTALTLCFLWPLVAMGDEAVAPKEPDSATMLKIPELFKTDSSHVKINIHDHVQTTRNGFGATPSNTRQSDFGLHAHYALLEPLSWNYQWYWRANSALHENNWKQESFTGQWRQLQNTDLTYQLSSEQPWQIRTFVHREDRLDPNQSQNFYELRQGLESSYQIHPWSKLRGEIRQEQALTNNTLTVERKMIKAGLSQQFGSLPWSLNLVPSLKGFAAE